MLRVWFRKIHFVCFYCKPPQHTPAFQSAAAAAASDHLCSAKKDEDDDAETKTQTCSELIMKSSIKRKDGRKRTLKWMDVAGKELVQVKEFQISEWDNRGCICSIL